MPFWSRDAQIMRLVGVLEPAAAEVRHRVGLAPDDVVEDPEAEILHRGADAEDVVVGADHPDRAVRLQHPASRQQPGAGKGVVGCEAVELVPVVVDRVDLGLVGAEQFAVELKIVGRVGEDDVDRLVRQTFERRHAIALENGVQPFRLRRITEVSSSRSAAADIVTPGLRVTVYSPVMVTV